MAIQIDIQTTGVNTLERAAEAFRKMSNSAEGADKAFSKLSSSEQKLITYFRELAKAVGQSEDEIISFMTGTKKLTQEVRNLEKGMSALAHMKQPFTQLSSATREYTLAVSALRKELIATAELSSGKLGNASYMRSVVDTKAAIILEQQLNAEIEKQARLRAENVMLNGGANAGSALSANIDSLKKARLETEKLALENKNLAQAQNQAAAAATKLAHAQSSIKQGAAVAAGYTSNGFITDPKLIERQSAALATLRQRLASLRGATSLPTDLFTQLQSAINQTSAALNLNGQSQRSVIAGLSQTIAAYEKLTVAQNQAAAAATKLAQAQSASAFKGGAANSILSNLTRDISQLDKMKVPTEKIKALKQAMVDLQFGLTTTGKLNTAGLKDIYRDINNLRGGLDSSKKTFTDWGKSAKFAIGGVARSFGAMTYSYTQLVPLLAGIAVGSVIKEVYELGAAIEYSLTYANALDESLNKMSVGDMTNQLLNQKGLRHDATETSKAVMEFVKAGIDANEVMADMGKGMTQLGEISRFAALGEMEIAEAVKVVVGQHYAFGESFVSIANKITVAAAESATDIKAMSAAFSYTTELATISKVTFSELATAMALMANKGIEGSKAGTALRTAVLRMQNPSEKLKGLLDDLGISWSAFTDKGQVKSLKQMVSSLKAVTENLPEPQRIAVLTSLFGLRELKAGAVLLASTGREWDKMWEKIEKSPGSADAQSALQKLNEQLSNTATHLKEVLAASFKNSLGKAYDPAPVAQKLKDLDAVANSDMFVDGISALVDALNLAGVGFTTILRAATVFYQFMSEHSKPPEVVAIADDWIGKIKEAYAYLEKEPPSLGSADFFLAPVEKIRSQIAAVKKLYGDYYEWLAETVYKTEKNKAAAEGARTVSTDPSAVAFADKSVDRLTSDQFNHYLKLEKGAQLTADTIERIFKEIDLDTAELTKYEKALKDIPEKAAKYFDDNKGVLGNDPGALKQIEDRMKASIDNSMLKEMQKDLDELDFKNMIKGLEATGTLADKNLAKYLQVREQARKYAKEKGSLEETDSGGWEFKPKAQKYFEALLRDQNLYIDKAASMEAATERVGREIRKLGEEQFGPNISEAFYMNSSLREKMTPYFDAIKSGVVEGLPLLTEWDLKLIDIEKQTAEMASKLDLDLDPKVHMDQINQLRNELTNIEKIKAFQSIKRDIQELNFSTMVGDLQRAGEETDKYANRVNKVKASYIQLKEEAYKQLNALGQATKSIDGKINFTPLGAEKFDAMVKNAHLFKDAIRDAKSEVYSMQKALQDLKIGFAKDISDVNAQIIEAQYGGVEGKRRAEAYSYTQDLQMIQKLRAAAEEAGKAGVEGRERQVELLRQAYDYAKSINTQSTDRGGNSEQDLRKLYQKKDLMIELERIQESLKTEDIKGAQGTVTALEAENKKHQEYIASMKEGYAASSGAAKSYQAVVAENVNGTIVWKDTTVSTTAEVKAAWEEVGRTIKQLPSPELSDSAQQFFSSSSYMKEAAGTWKEMTEAEQRFWSFGLSDKPKIIEGMTSALSDQKEKYTELSGVVDEQKGKYEELAKMAKEYFGSSATAARGYVTIVSESGQGMTEWRVDSVEALREVIRVWEELGETIKNLPTPPKTSTSSYGGARATGGPVSVGKTYMVGEVGPELFTPKSNGFITPNNKLTTSRDSVDINLSINGSEPVTVQGDKMTVAKLERMFRDNLRYAS